MKVEEVFKDIPGYEGLYQVSNTGKVRSLDKLVRNKNGFRKIKGNIKIQSHDSTYKSVHLYKKSKSSTFRTHQLVAMAFLNHTPCGYKIVVDHKDNNPLNNKLDNLQLITNRVNSVKNKDKSKTTSKYIGVYQHKKSEKWISRILVNSKREYLGSFNTEIDANIAYKNKLKQIQNGN